MKKQAFIPICSALTMAFVGSIFLLLSRVLADEAQGDFVSSLFISATVLFLLQGLLQIILSYIYKEEKETTLNPIINKVFSGILSLVFIIFAFLAIQNFFSLKLIATLKLQYVFYLPISIFSVLAAFSFAVDFALPNEYTKLKYFTSCFSYIAPLLYALALYFEPSAHLNSIGKRSLIVSFMLFGLIMIYFVRMRYSNRGRFFKTIVLISTPFLFGYSFSSILSLLFKKTIYLSLYPYIILFILSIIMMFFIFPAKQKNTDTNTNGGDSHEEDSSN